MPPVPDPLVTQLYAQISAHRRQETLTAAVIVAADRVASSKGHAQSCAFSACSCGVVEDQKAALSDYWKLRRVGQ